MPRDARVRYATLREKEAVGRHVHPGGPCVYAGLTLHRIAAGLKATLADRWAGT
jgi:hypothetical protein